VRDARFYVQNLAARPIHGYRDRLKPPCEVDWRTSWPIELLWCSETTQREKTAARFNPALAANSPAFIVLAAASYLRNFLPF